MSSSDVFAQKSAAFDRKFGFVSSNAGRIPVSSLTTTGLKPAKTKSPSLGWNPILDVEEGTMIEVAFTYDFQPGINTEAYAELAKRATAMMLSAPGFIEFRAHRNFVGSPHVRRTSVWQSLTHWVALAEQPEFQKLTAEFRTFVTNLEVQFWGPSPISPHPIKAQ
jgi:heme-degrading monooxygenase HmoA